MDLIDRLEKNINNGREIFGEELTKKINSISAIEALTTSAKGTNEFCIKLKNGKIVEQQIGSRANFSQDLLLALAVDYTLKTMLDMQDNDFRRMFNMCKGLDILDIKK